jgi:hypothetical protein
MLPQRYPVRKMDQINWPIFISKVLNLLVAGEGFEPPTLGL